MAHHDSIVAQRAEEQARTSESQHTLLQQLRQEPLLSQVETWRNSIEDFRSSRQPEHLKQLREFLAKLRLAPHNSRYVEAEHTKTQVGLRRAHHHGDAFVPFLRRQPALMAEVKSNPGLVEELAKHVADLRHGGAQCD